MAKRSNFKIRNEATRQQALDLLTAEIKASPSGEVITSAQRLGTRVGRAPQTVSAWLSGWAKDGFIALERLPGNRGIKVRLSSAPSGAAGTEARVVSFPVTGSEASSETVSVTSQEATQATDVEARQEASSETNSEARREAKPRKRRQPVRRNPKPEISLAAVPVQSVSTVTVDLARQPLRTAWGEASSRKSRETLLGGVLRLFTLAAIALSVAMVAMHVAGTEDEDPFAWWSLLLASVLVSLLKPVLGTVAERLYEQRSWLAATLASIVALGALAYDATNLWAFRGSGLEDKAATSQAVIEARSRDKAKLEDLIAERKRLTETERPRPVGVVTAAIERTRAEPRCRPVRVSPKSKETAVPASCTRALADLEAEQAKAERVEELAGLIEAATLKLEARPVRADAEGGAKAAAATINWVSQGVLGLNLASPTGVTTGWSLAFVLLIEIVAVAGFALAVRIERFPGKGGR